MKDPLFSSLNPSLRTNYPKSADMSQSKQNIKFSVLPSADFLSDINSGRVDVDNERHNTQYDGSCIQSIAHNNNNGIATDKKGFLENEIKTHRATGGARYNNNNKLKMEEKSQKS